MCEPLPKALSHAHGHALLLGRTGTAFVPQGDGCGASMRSPGGMLAHACMQVAKFAAFMARGLFRHYKLYQFAFTRDQGHTQYTAQLLVGPGAGGRGQAGWSGGAARTYSCCAWGPPTTCAVCLAGGAHSRWALCNRMHLGIYLPF
jgi:hypothetical protein